MNKISTVALIREYYGYGLLLLTLLGLKAFHRMAHTDDLLWLLAPLSLLVELYGKAQFAYVPDWGYWDEARHILVDKSCSGFNFLLILLGLLYVTWVPAQTHWRHLFLRVIPLIGLAYLLSIVVNAGRMICILSVQDKLVSWGMNPALAHEMLGIFIFWGSLFLIYQVIQRIPIKQ